MALSAVVFNLPVILLGLIFVIHGLAYALTAPIIGRICDKGINLRVLMLLGSVFVIISVLLVGPAPFFKTDPSVGLVSGGLVCFGLAMSLILVPSFLDAIKTATNYGFDDGIATYALASGMWSSSFALGAFIGPSLAGVLFESFGFAWGTMFIVAVHVIIIICLVTNLCNRRRAYMLIETKDNANESQKGLTMTSQKAYGTCSSCGDKVLFDRAKKTATVTVHVEPVL